MITFCTSALEENQESVNRPGSRVLGPDDRWDPLRWLVTVISEDSA